MRQRLTAISATTLLAISLVGCSGGEGGGSAPPEESPPSALPDLTDDPEAAAAVSDALAALRAGNSGTFTAHLEYAETTYDHNGSYRLEPPQHRVSVVADLEEGPVDTEAVGAAGRYFVRLPPDGPVSSDCWVSGDPSAVAEVTGLETNPAFRVVPGAIGLASTAVGVAFADRSDEVLGSVDLATALGLVSPRLPALLGIAAGQERVLARFELTDGVLSAVRVDGPAVLAALATVGTDVDPEELARVFGADTPIEVTLSDSGAQVIIEPPARPAVIDLAVTGAQQRLGACG